MTDVGFSTSLSQGLSEREAHDLACLLSQLLRQERDRIESVPLIAPAMLLGAPELAEVRDQMRPPEGMGVLHESQMFRRARALPMAKALSVAGSAEDRGESRCFGFSLQDEEDVIGEMETRLRFVTREVMAALKGVEMRPAMQSPDMIWLETMPIARTPVDIYLALSHDPNPIHREDAAARAVGLSQAVVPGMLIAGLCEAALAAVGEGADEMRTRFLAALPVDASLRLAVQIKTAAPVMRARVFAIDAADRIVAISDASREPAA